MTGLLATGGYSFRSWLLTRGPARIALLYFFSTTAFFLLGLAFAAAMYLELLTPPGNLFAAETYAKLFTMHGLVMVLLFLLPALTGVAGSVILAQGGVTQLPRLAPVAWYLHLLGGGVLLWVLASGGVGTGWTFEYASGAPEPVAVAKAGAGIAQISVGLMLISLLIAGSRNWRDLSLLGPRPAPQAYVWAVAVLMGAGAAALAVLPFAESLGGTYFETGCFHLLISGAGLAAYFGCLHQRWEALTGRPPSESAGRFSGAAIAIGGLLTFLPQLVLGWAGLPRRSFEYAAGFQPWQIVSGMGAALLVAGCLLAPCYLVWSLITGRRATGSP